MSKRLALALIAIGWMLAAITIWQAGRWAERTSRYDGCELVQAGETVFWACPVKLRPPPPPTGGADV